jgi:hypothetical protein
MILFLLLALLPLTAEAQVTFDPLRLDDSLAHTFYYPNVVSVGDTTLRCMWASQLAATVMAHSRIVGLDGEPVGPRTVLDSANGQFTCPASVSLMPLNSGGEARLVHHS